MRVVLLSTYELGRQPFGLASPAAWLRRAGHEVSVADLSRQELPAEAAAAGLVAFYLPMHTATRLAVPYLKRVREANPAARLCCYGLYAPMNAAFLRTLGVDAIVGGEFEQGLVALASGADAPSQVSLERQRFVTPDRAGLPPAPEYARLIGLGAPRVAGYTEATRGCKHLCRHCPIVPVYNGQFRVVQRDVVLEDIARQVAAGCRHITFGDPDFFNGPAHAMAIVEELHARFPELTYDATIKVEHLLKHRDLLGGLKRTGCLFVVSAVESLDDAVLERLDKGHTRADFFTAVRLMREAGLALQPTFVTFTPWTSREGLRDLLRTVADLGLVEHVAPIQYAIRLLIPEGSRLLELDEVRALVGAFDAAALAYPWRHPDPEIDALPRLIQGMIHREERRGAGRAALFARIWDAVFGETFSQGFVPPDRTQIPYLNEPWYC